ncbi:MAG: hypothetical protein ACE5HQ_13115, partial [Gemmatimonadota bacterium]
MSPTDARLADATPPVRFLHALGNLLNVAGLYNPDHPARGRALEAVLRELAHIDGVYVPSL